MQSPRQRLIAKLPELGNKTTALVFLSRYFIKQLDDDEFKELYNLDMEIACSERTFNMINVRRKALKLPRPPMAQKD